MTNNDHRDYSVLKWRTPLSGMTFDFLTVMYKGKRLDYDGIFMKRRNSLGADQFLFVAAGQTVSSTFDVSAGYDVNKSGKYSVAHG